MYNTNLLFDFDDMLIQPAVHTSIRSRKEVNPRYELEMLPLMTAPMDTVIDTNNALEFQKRGIWPIMPRKSNTFTERMRHIYFFSYGLEEFETEFLTNGNISVPNTPPILALIDIANGHMDALYDVAKKAKKMYKDKLSLMIGNIANPETFYDFASIGVDYVRIGIGNGNGCLTTVQTGIGYPIASLIAECNRGKRNTKIVADGGFKKYSDVIKGLALGADYVMLGSILNKSLESAGETTKEHGEIVDQYSKEALEMFNAEIPLYKSFRGMSTKEVQKAWGKDDLKTSEGVVRRHKVEYTLDGWTQNFEAYLRSAMSYTGKKELRDFIGGVHYNLITQNAFNRFNK